MDLFKTYNEFLLESSSSKEIIVYHKSDNLEHMLNCDFKLEYAEDVSLFGHAIYFSSSPGAYFGKYCCKFSIILEEPVLDMNKEIPSSVANRLLKDFNSLFDKNIKYHFQNKVQFGEFFTSLYPNCIYYRKFIQEWLKYNSFKYYQNSMTDFITKKGDYGTSYGIYNPKNIKFIDGPLKGVY